MAEQIPWIVGGAADLTPSTKTRLTFASASDFQSGEFARRSPWPQYAFRRA